MLAVSDNSPVRYLRVLACDHVLPVLFGRVLIPRAVLRELQHPHTPAVVRTWMAAPPGWQSAPLADRLMRRERCSKQGSKIIVLTHEFGVEFFS